MSDYLTRESKLVYFEGTYRTPINIKITVVMCPFMLRHWNVCQVFWEDFCDAHIETCVDDIQYVVTSSGCLTLMLQYKLQVQVGAAFPLLQSWLWRTKNTTEAWSSKVTASVARVTGTTRHSRNDQITIHLAFWKIIDHTDGRIIVQI